MNTRPPSTPPTATGRWFLAGIGIFLAAIGGIFVWLMARSCLRAIDMRSWPKVPCRILTSELIERRHDDYSPPEYSHHLTFTYIWQDRTLTSDRISLRGDKWSSKRATILPGLTGYPAGSQHQCLVNPDNPALAVLEADSLAPGYSIWFPCLFLVGGSVMAWRALRLGRSPVTLP